MFSLIGLVRLVGSQAFSFADERLSLTRLGFCPNVSCQFAEHMGRRKVSRVQRIKSKSLILAQNERWRRG